MPVSEGRPSIFYTCTLPIIFERLGDFCVIPALIFLKYPEISVRALFANEVRTSGRKPLGSHTQKNFIATLFETIFL